MTIWPHQQLARTFYGDPDPEHDGVPSRAWEDAALTTIVPPYRMVLAWDTSRVVRKIRVHRKCAWSLTKILTGIANHFGSEQDLEANRMHLYGGCYNFRTMRGSNKLSMHSYGCAIDLDPEANYLGREYQEGLGMMPMAVVKLFEDEGWTWGGKWRRADAQHFQAASL
jgi:hypothetical protein